MTLKMTMNSLMEVMKRGYRKELLLGRELAEEEETREEFGPQRI